MDCDDSDAAIYPTSSTATLPGDPTGFPRIGALWLEWREDGAPDWCQAASYTMFIDGGALETLERDHSDASSTVEARAILHALNPDQVVFGNLLGGEFQDGDDIDPAGEVSCWSDATDLLADADGPISPAGYDLNVVNVTDADTRACVVEFDTARMDALLVGGPGATYELYDGAFIVSSTTGADAYLTTDTGAARSYDLDGDGVTDTDLEVTQAWGNGMAALVSDLVDAFSAEGIPVHTSGFDIVGARRPIVGLVDGMLDPNGWTNAYEGAAYDDDRLDDFDAWLANLHAERFKVARTSGLTLSLMRGDSSITDTTAPAGASEYDDVRTDYARMRYGLVSALLAGTGYSYEWGNAGHGQGWWYDEYDNNGSGLGYLGAPVADAIPLSTPSGTNLVANGGFDSGIDGWDSWVCDTSTDESCVNDFGTVTVTTSPTDAEGSASSGSLMIDITRDDDQDYWAWDVTVNTTVDLVPDTDYTLSFAVAWDNSTSPDTHGVAQIQPYLQHIYTDGVDTMYEDIDLAPMMSIGGRDDSGFDHYVVALDTHGLTASYPDSTFRLVFAVGNHEGTAWLDDVELVEGTLSPVWYREFDNGLAIINAGDGTEDVDLTGLSSSTTTWTAIDGDQDPTVNDGATGLESLTLGPKEARILLR